MFVSQRKYDDMVQRAIKAEASFYALKEQWNELVGRINAKGGAKFLRSATIQPVSQFTEAELTKLVLLCHPDKHEGKPMATEITQRLLAIKQNLTKEPA